jgi:hypothetical protein
MAGIHPITLASGPLGWAGTADFSEPATFDASLIRRFSETGAQLRGHSGHLDGSGALENGASGLRKGPGLAVIRNYRETGWRTLTGDINAKGWALSRAQPFALQAEFHGGSSARGTAGRLRKRRILGFFDESDVAESALAPILSPVAITLAR